MRDVNNECMLEEVLNLVRDEARGKEFRQAVKNVVKRVVEKSGLEPATPIRRDHDGVSSLDWLVEKMLGEYLKNERINW